MKKLIFTLLIFFPIITCAQDTLVVKKGETLWSISRHHFGDSTLWETFFASNPFLMEGRCRMEDGKTIVDIFPDEKLEVPSAYTIALISRANNARREWANRNSGSASYLSWFLPLIAIPAGFFWWLKSLKNPVTSRPPKVPIGLDKSNLAEAFQNMANAVY